MQNGKTIDGNNGLGLKVSLCVTTPTRTLLTVMVRKVQIHKRAPLFTLRTRLRKANKQAMWKTRNTNATAVLSYLKAMTSEL